MKANTATVISRSGGRRARPGTALLVVFYVGTPAVNAAVDPALKSLGAAGPEGLPAGGYVLAAGQAAGAVRLYAAAPADYAAG